MAQESIYYPFDEEFSSIVMVTDISLLPITPRLSVSEGDLEGPSSKFSLISCVLFCKNTIGKGMDFSTD